jgi:FdhD protein
VSRHNGVDTVCGWLALHGVTGHGKTLFTTGRLTAEMVLKAALHGITTLISRNGTTAVGCDVAARLHLTLIGRAANRRYIRYVDG